MSRLSHGAARELFRNSEPVSESGTSLSEIGKSAFEAHRRGRERVELARICLSSHFASPKEWGADLHVSDRLVRMWASGEAMIPECRATQIILQARTYKIRSRDLDAAVDAAINELLAHAYGAAKGSM